MASYHASNNKSYGKTIQINGPVHGNVSPAVKLQPSFFKTSNYKAFKDINPPRVRDTCVWFLEHPTFQKWKASSTVDLLWLSADPGCGKSVLSRALIDEKELLSAEPVTLCYFFFKDNSEQSNNTTALCALLHQFFCAHESLLQKYAAKAKQQNGLALKNDFDGLWKIFTSAATDPLAGEVICILDALDECQESDQKILIHHVQRFYEEFTEREERGFKLKFLMTSRPYSDIEYQFSILLQRIPTIRLAGEEESEKISREIGIFMAAKVNEIADRRRLGNNVRESLLKRLAGVENRTYLWLHLTLDQVKTLEGKTLKKWLEAIDTLPQTVEEAYEKILARCNRQNARTALRIIVAAQRPLTLREIDVALAITEESTSCEDLDLEGDTGRREWVRNSCGLFVSIVDSRVFLIHQTAREFLLRKNEHNGLIPGAWKHSISLREAHRNLSEICITYLRFPEYLRYRVSPEQWMHTREPNSFWRTRTLLSMSHIAGIYAKDAFLPYSSNYWTLHFRKAQIESSVWLSRAAKLCNVDDLPSTSWIYISSNFQFFRAQDSSLLRYAIQKGFDIDAIAFLKCGLFPSAQDDDITSLLCSAARTAGREVMATLLELHGDKIRITEETLKEAALNVRKGKDIVEFLLSERGDEVKITEKVLKAAASNRFTGRDIIELLLRERGDEVKITEDVLVRTVLDWESGGDIIELLLRERGDEVKITEKVLKAAASNRFTGRDIIELLLRERGDEVKITEDVLMQTVLNWECGRDIMALLLKQRGNEVNITEKVLKVVVQDMLQGGEIIDLLLEQRGDNVSDRKKLLKAHNALRRPYSSVSRSSSLEALIDETDADDIWQITSNPNEDDH